jgi:thiol-disulfide isomerase/thioredoxin
MTVGLIVVVAVVVLGSAIGLWHRRVDGRLRPGGAPSRRPAPAEPAAASTASRAGDAAAGWGGSVSGAAAGSGGSLATTAAGSGALLASAAAGSGGSVSHTAAASDASVSATAAVSHAATGMTDADSVSGAGSTSSESAVPQRVAATLLAELGVEPARATLLQFSSAFCAPCRALRRVSAEVAAMVPGVRHVEVDAESHLDAVRALHVWRTPTLFVLDADGRIRRRATGVPGKPQLIAALGEVLTGESAPGCR